MVAFMCEKYEYVTNRFKYEIKGQASKNAPCNELFGTIYKQIIFPTCQGGPPLF